ncbi:hypothetical protein PC116_g11025 [Phytophthora cactorum]|uniref:Chromo domain-containing protein n=1 Tax=Phytophthora cactorum TaxID=29920 RepID=A0A329SUQ1_9STRA|nr:hypothetical protein Pcac1_g2506 [Phytophthora cactorum]KAG2914442.1 hypothetical protein PC114_g8175 [Phytophthora cactorum]KAG2946531.1 hypothetical protein PC117_g7549 [Phytophthora cactorum]KAG3026654.1 hypothetical protein PC119_g7708 [Phytophthora cactorum]KAG4241032.1 hypothetical protein PC116_g11025 [Phytophthora cactorum]
MSFRRLFFEYTASACRSAKRRFISGNFTDFGEELLPDDSSDQEPATDEFQVEAILDDRVPVSTGTERPVREFKINWVGYYEPSWEPVSNLSCGG